MKVSVDQNLCIGCETCPVICPEIFAMYPNSNFAYALIEEVPAELEDCAREACRTCPVEAIIIEED
ncbi:MAG: ferredoxin [Clostridia bacterium]|nr:ferredoxin [Clostridia bacterium]